MNTKIETKEKWIDWAIKLQAIAQSGLYYTKNPFEIERYEKVRDIALEILNEHTFTSIDKIKDLFDCDYGYKTPKLDSRAVCFKDDKILLVQESDGRWSIPGGWCDIDQSIANNCIKESMEEAGACVEPDFVIAIHNWSEHLSNTKKRPPFEICKIFIMCKLKNFCFKQNTETLQADFFSFDELPEISIGKTTIDQIKLCFKANEFQKQNKYWKTIFD